MLFIMILFRRNNQEGKGISTESIALFGGAMLL
jgi:hypothetical protein